MSPTTTLIGSGDIIVGAWRNFRRNIRTYAECMLWFVLLRVVQWGLTVLTERFIADRALRFGVDILFAIPIMLLYTALTISLIEMVASQLRDGRAGGRVTLRPGLRKLLPLIWVSIIVGVLVSLGFIVFIIPGVLLLVWYRFSQDFVILDGLRGRAALIASKKLVAGRWWKAFTRIALPGIFYMVAVMFVTYLCYFIASAILRDSGAFFGQLTTKASLPTAHVLIKTVLTAAINGLALPLFVASDLILWYELKRAA